MLHLKKIQTHEEKAKLNALIAEDLLQKGEKDKSNHFKRISEAHYRNAIYYRKQSDLVSLAMAF